MKNKSIFIAVLLLVTGSYGFTQSSRNLLTQSYTAGYLQQHLAQSTEWVKFPAYSQRKRWELLPDLYKKQWIAEGEKALGYQWQLVPASAYLEFLRSGNRDIMQKPNNQNTSALRKLVLAELVEGKGRFIPQIIDGAWALCEMTTWSLSAHLSAQKKGAGLPDVADPIIDLGVGMTSSLLAWTHYFFSREFDAINPLISQRILHEINRQVLQPYYTRNDFWWMALNKEGAMVNNWNVWINYNVLTCILLAETDPQKRLAGIDKTMRSVDQFLNYYKDDGGCEEGPAYWSHAGGMLYQYLHLLSEATGGAVNIFNRPLVKNIGNYICKAYISDRYYLNYADASAKLNPDAGLVYDFGKAVNDKAMKNFGTYLALQQNWKEQVPGETVETALNNIFEATEVVSGTNARPTLKEFWLPGTQIMGGRDSGEDNTGFYFSALGGHNGESHNHNDVGSCIVFYNGYPILIDIGSENYTRQTFGPERYTIWTMQSAYHNVPLINGVQQKDGKKYAARNAVFASDTSGISFSVNIAGAYPEAAKVNSWVRSYRLNRGRSFSITDSYDLQENNGKNAMHFMTPAKADNSKEGQLRLTNGTASLILQYDPQQLHAVVESITIKDSHLLQSWPPTVYRIIFNVTGNQKTGMASIVVTPGNNH